jgi:hypothetical protein
LNLQKNDPDFYFSLAKLYDKTGEKKKSREFREQGIEVAKKLKEAEKEAVENPAGDQPEPGQGPVKAQAPGRRPGPGRRGQPAH